MYVKIKLEWEILGI